MVTIKFIFDIASPNGYLCHKVIPDYEKKYSVRFDYDICLLGGIHKLSNNQPPMISCLLYTSPSPRDGNVSRMPSSA